MRILLSRSPPFDLSGYIAWTEVFSDGTSRTRLEHRVVMETYLGRELEYWEIVHHKDHDKRNNDLSNLEVLTRSDHAKLHGKDRTDEATLSLICIYCNKSFGRLSCIEHYNRKQGKVGPFCSKKCVGEWSRLQQLNRMTYGPKRCPHGTLNGYKHFKCRCVDCTLANNIACKKYRHTKSSQPGGTANTPELESGD